MKVNIRFPLPELVQQLRQAQGKLHQDRKELMDKIGVQLLSLSQLAYRKKARGEQGGDGITWRKLRRSTLKARVMRRAAGRNIVSQRKAIAKQIVALIGVKGTRTRKPKRLIGKRAAVARANAKRRQKSPTRAIQKRLRTMPKIKGRGKNVKDQVAKLRRKRLELLLKLEQLVDREAAQYEIGVDTGLQRASASPGFHGADGKGGNLFVSTDAAVTVGYHRNYSTFFDEARPLLPDQLPKPWLEPLERITTVWAEKVCQSAFD